MSREGWICAKCGCGVSPDVERCDCAGTSLTPFLDRLTFPAKPVDKWPWKEPWSPPYEITCGSTTTNPYPTTWSVVQ